MIWQRVMFDYPLEVIRNEKGRPDSKIYFDQWKHLIQSGSLWRRFKHLAQNCSASDSEWGKTKTALASWEILDIIGFPHNMELNTARRLFDIARLAAQAESLSKKELSPALVANSQEAHEGWNDDWDWDWDAYCRLRGISREWDETINVTALLVYENRGVACRLRLKRRAGGSGQVFRSAAAHPFLTIDWHFTQALEMSIRYIKSKGAPFDKYDFQWSLTFYDKGFTPPRLSGTSMGAAFALGFSQLLLPSSTLSAKRLESVAVTAQVMENGRLQGISGLSQKVDALKRLERPCYLFVASSQDIDEHIPAELGEIQLRQVGSVDALIRSL